MTCHIAPYSGYELRANLEGLLKKFRVTKENEKEEEIFTLANLDNGCIRKFIVKKVDESAFLASINNKSIKEEIKSLKDENENTAVLEGGEDHGDGQPLVLNDALSASTERLSDSHKDDNKKNESLVNGQLKNLNSGKPARFKVGGDDSDDSMPCEEKEDKDDPGVVNPTFFTDDEDDICRGDESTASVSTRSSPDLSPSHSPRLSFKSVSDMSAPVSPRHSPVSHRSGNLSHRSSVSSVRKGILKKSGSSSTINMEMVNLGLQQNAALNAAANSASGMNGYHKARFTDPYDECYVPVDTHRFVSAPDESSGMTQKSLGGHRVKFILETGKPDHVNGDYDDIRIEKMERERIERIERGKNLEVTNNSGDKGGRKCLLFCAAMLVLTASVITAGLYGSGRLGMIASYGKTGIPNNGGDGSNGSGSQGKADSFKTIYYVPNALEVRFKINNRMYNDTLSNIDSSEFKSLSSDLEDKLSTLLLPHNGKADLSLKIIKFEPGSIICTFRIAWTFFGELFGDKTPPLNVTVVQDKLEQIFTKKDDPDFEGYDVHPDSVQVSALADKCKNNETKCSHHCVFREESSLRFECSCPDHLILKQDKTNCYTHDLSSTMSTYQQTEASSTTQTITSHSPSSTFSLNTSTSSLRPYLYTFPTQTEETSDFSTFFTETNLPVATDFTTNQGFTTNTDPMSSINLTEVTDESLTTADKESTAGTFTYSTTDMSTEADLTTDMGLGTETSFTSETYSTTGLDESSAHNPFITSETSGITEIGTSSWTDLVTKLNSSTDLEITATTFVQDLTTEADVAIEGDGSSFTKYTSEADVSGRTDTSKPDSTIGVDVTATTILDLTSESDITTETAISSSTEFILETDTSNMDLDVTATTRTFDLLTSERDVTTETGISGWTDLTSEADVSRWTELEPEINSSITSKINTTLDIEVFTDIDFQTETGFTTGKSVIGRTDSIAETSFAFGINVTTQNDLDTETGFTVPPAKEVRTESSFNGETEFTSEIRYIYRVNVTNETEFGFTTAADSLTETDIPGTGVTVTIGSSLEINNASETNTPPEVLLTTVEDFSYRLSYVNETNLTSEIYFTIDDIQNHTLQTDFATEPSFDGQIYFTTEPSNHMEIQTNSNLDDDRNTDEFITTMDFTTVFGSNSERYLSNNIIVTTEKEASVETTSELNSTLQTESSDWKNITLESVTESVYPSMTGIVNVTVSPSGSGSNNGRDLNTKETPIGRDLVPEIGFISKIILIEEGAFSNRTEIPLDKNLVPETGFKSKTMFVENSHFFNETYLTGEEENNKKKVIFKNAITDVLRSDAVLLQIKTEVKDEEKEEVDPAKPDESKKTENATATSATDASQPGSGDIVHSQEGVGNTTLITESGMVNGTLTGSEQITSNGTNIVNGTGMDIINNTTDTVQLNATNEVMNTTGTEFNVTSVAGHVTNETLANGTVHMHPFTINGTIVAEHPLLNLSGKFDEFFVSPGTRGETQEIFTNSSKVLPPQDLSDLRPGGSPGDARLQTLDVPEENIGIFNESHQTSDNSSSIVTDINTLHDEDGMGNAFNHTHQENTTLNESFPSVQTNFSSQSPVDTHTTTTTQQSTVNAMSGDPEVKVTKVPNEQNEEETQEITRVEDKSPPLVGTTINSTTLETNGEQEINSNISEGATQENTSGDTQTISHNSDESRVIDNNSGMPISIDTILDTSSDLGMIGITSDLGNSTSHEITTKATTSVMVSAAPELKDKTSVHTQTEDEHISQSDKGILTTPQSPQLKVNCTEEMFECVNGNSPVGSRIPYTARCNSIPDCSDGSDELNCVENNCFDNFKCRDNECIERQYVCDGIANCRDGEDEMNCESWECRDCEFKCTGPEPSPCIPLSLTCDGQPDCFDHSDEVNCSTSCKTEEFQCKEGWCIPIARKCDGIQDCYGGEDESECDCLLDLTSCAMGGCVPKFQLCDGLRNCADGSDEWKCIRIENGTNQLEVRRGENRWVGVCGEGWTYEWSDLACQHLGSVTTYSMQVTRVSDVPRHRVKLASTQKPSSNTPLQFTLKSECESDKLVQLTCDPPAACGSWQDFTNVEAMEGITPAEHVWPSLVLVRDVNSNSTCTASILTPYWVLAAYSCVYTKKDGLIPDTWVVQTGTAGQGHNYLVANMISYPGKVRRGGIWSGDAVLLLLEKPLKLDEKTQPICIPDAPPPTDGNCVVAGWNRSRDGTISQDQFIHSVAVPTLEVDACNTTHYPGRLTNAHTCIGFTQAQNPPCQGDEGTPLMCKSKSGVWRIEGLSSHHGRCGRSQHPSVFTALHALQPWLSNTIGLPSSYGMPTETTTPITSTTTTSTATTVTTTATEKPSSATLPPPSLNSEDFERPQVSSPGNAPL